MRENRPFSIEKFLPARLKFDLAANFVIVSGYLFDL